MGQAVRSLAFKQPIKACAWSPDGSKLAALLEKGKLVIRDISRKVRSSQFDVAGSWLVWSPTADHLAILAERKLTIWDVGLSRIKDERSFPEKISDAVWSPDSQMLAVSFATGAMEILDFESLETVSWSESHDQYLLLDWTKAGQVVGVSPGLLTIWEEPSATNFGFANELEFCDDSEETQRPVEDDWIGITEADVLKAVPRPHDGRSVTDITSLPNGRIATCGLDGTLKIISPLGLLENIYQNPTGSAFIGISANSSGRFLAALDAGGNVQVIDILTFTIFGMLEATESAEILYIEMRPGTFEVSLVDSMRHRVKIYNLAETMKLGGSGAITHYRNAKVVLVGDSGVGKSGLALALAGKEFVPTESTHARNVWTLNEDSLIGETEAGEQREVLLWDLAGQPGYRLFHKLSLRDVSVGLIVFDARSENEPFRGVPYWSKALDDGASHKSSMTKILVSARNDRGGLPVSSERIEEALQRHKISEYHETSAKTHSGIPELIECVRNSIPWSSLPIVAAPNIFSEVRNYLIAEKRRGVLLVTHEELQQGFRNSKAADSVSTEILDACLGRLEATGLVARISFGDRWLLQPELLDSYVAWLAHAARSEPDGLGAIEELRALKGEFAHEVLPRVSDEQAMLVTAVEEVVGRGLALRVPTERSQMIVFPSELRADLPHYPEGYAIEVIFKFEGHVAAIYATITVLLINSLGFGREYKLFKNAAIFGYGTDRLCGIAAHYEPGEDDVAGRAVVFFGPSVGNEQKLSFLRYIDFQLSKLAISGSVKRERIYTCYSCGYTIPSDVVRLRSERGEETVICPICVVHMPMDNLLRDSAVKDRRTSRLIRQAVNEQERQQRLASYSLRREIAQHHVFICYNSVDRSIVMNLNRSLKDQGVITWVDDTKVVGGDQHTRAIESVIDSVPCAVIAVGPNSLGPWQEQEYYALLGQAVNRRKKGAQLRIIPVLLPGATDIEELPPFLGVNSVIDMRGHDAGGELLRSLVEAILMPARIRV